jgi:hypothetical protein
MLVGTIAFAFSGVVLVFVLGLNGLLLASCGSNHPQNDIFGYYNAPRLAKAVQAN